jgi:hypothetical protein
MAVRIDRFKLSLIWSETVLDLLKDRPPNAPMLFLGRNYTYGPHFADAVKEQAVMRKANLRPTGELQPPWPEPVGHRFWMYYLQRRTLDDVKGQEAWDALVPFRIRPRFNIQANAPIDRVLAEGFAYPHGYALVLTLECSDAFALEAATIAAQELRRTRQLTLTWDDGSVEQCQLDVLASKTMQALRKTVFGANVGAGTTLAVDPFSVLTILQAEGTDAETSVQPNGPVHQMLEAVTQWRSTWRTDVLPELSQVDVGRFRQRPSSGIVPRLSSGRRIIYGRERGRAIWFSDCFAPPAPGKPSTHLLGCYHRNLVFASLQGESLLGLLAVTAQMNPPLPDWHDQCAKNAARVIGLLYGGVKWTYRTSSLRAQVDQQDLVTTVNTVRARYKGMGPLS